jgi:hypothetical protein
VRTEAKVEDFRDAVETQIGTVEQDVTYLRVSHLFSALIPVLMIYGRTTLSIKLLKNCSIVFDRSGRHSMTLQMRPKCVWRALGSSF